jgi:signal transduction histidine kinase
MIWIIYLVFITTTGSMLKMLFSGQFEKFDSLRQNKIMGANVGNFILIFALLITIADTPVTLIISLFAMVLLVMMTLALYKREERLEREFIDVKRKSKIERDELINLMATMNRYALSNSDYGNNPFYKVFCQKLSEIENSKGVLIQK